MWLFCIFTCLVILSLYQLWKNVYRKHFYYWPQYQSLARVPGIIFVNNFWSFVTFKTNFAYYLKTIYDDPKYASAPVVGVCGFITPGLLIREPEIVKSMLVKDFDCFCDRFSEPNAHHDPIGSLNMFFARYAIWKDIRRKLSPIFTSGKLKYMYPLIQNIGNNMDKYLKRQPSVFSSDVKELCIRFTTDVIATTIFGIDSNSLDNPVEHVSKEVRKLTSFNWFRGFHMLLILHVPQWVSFFKAKTFYTETESFLRSSIGRVVKERESCGGKRNDLIDIFLQLKQEAIKSGEGCDNIMECLAAQAGVFMIGGFDTTSTTISNALLELAKHPVQLRRLRDEIREVFIMENGQISYEGLNNMKYLGIVVSETLRMYPILPYLERKYAKPAQRTEPYTLQPYCEFALPEGMPIYISPYALHYDVKYWPNPTKFDPERFADDNKNLINPMVYLPFGSGPHNCIGSRLGLLQVKTGLISILKNHFVRICEKTDINPEFDAKAVTLQVKGGVYLEIVRDDLCDKVLIKL